MSRHNAPLYVEAHDLARWVLERVEAWPPERGRSLERPLCGAACELLASVSLALTFPEGRSEYLRTADESIVRLRMMLRLAQDLALISPGGLRHALGRLRTIGRMLGGWQRQLRRPTDLDPSRLSPSRYQGTGSPASTV